MQDYLDRYFYLLLSPQGLGLRVNQRQGKDIGVEVSERCAAPIRAS